MKRAILLLMLVLIAASAQAVELSFKDSETGTTIADKIISIDIDGKESTKQIDSQGKIDIQIKEGQTIELTADNPETQGKDYYGKIIYDGDNEILLFPIASLRGIVKDSLDNIVSYADLKFACKPLPKIRHPSNADKFGTFSTITPTGKCKVYASYEDALGFEEIIIEQGELRDVEINLDKTIVSFPAKTYAGWIIAAVLAIIAFAAIAFFVTRGKAPKPKIIKIGNSEEFPNSQKPTVFAQKERSKDILPTLGKKEKEIVTYLQLNKGKALQSQIRHHTGIPRTTLARIIKGLEDKNILKVRKEGKAVKIRLTDWFLGKE